MTLTTARRLYKQYQQTAAVRALTKDERTKLLNITATIRRLTGKHEITL